jgi:iron complex outermembrane recepter protein
MMFSTVQLFVPRSRKLLASCALQGLLATLAAPSLAQTAPESPELASLGEIIVTGSRRDEALVEVPSSVTVVSPASTLRAGITDINGIADLVPNLQATDGGSPSLGNLTIRGIFTGGSPTVGTYIDDVPYGPVVGGAGTSLALDGSLLDLSRIEVNRGPQGTLFGASAVGGVVRYITEQPDLTGFQGYASGDLSFTRNGGTNYTARGRVSAPLMTDRFAVAVSGFYSNADGYIDHPARAAKNVDGYEFWGGSASALFKVTEDLSIRANVIHQQAKFDNASYVGFNPTTGQTYLGDLTDITQVSSPRTINYDLYSLAVDYDAGFAKFTSVTSWQDLDFTTLSDLTGTIFPGFADLLAPAGAPHTAALEAPFRTRRFTQEFRLTSADNETLEWLVGGYYTHQKSDQGQRIIVTPADVNLLDVSSPLKYKEYAAFGNVTYYITPRWDITAGIRIADNSLSSEQAVSGFFVPPSFNAPANRQSDSVATYLVNTRFRVSDAVNLYARAASGYRPGGSNLVTRDALGNPVGTPAYDADELWSYEVGAKGALADNRLSYSASFYLVRWKDAQVSFVQANGLGGTANAQGSIHASGFEGEIGLRPLEGLSLSATMAISAIDFQRNEPLFGALAGDRLPNVPKTSGSLLADYTFGLTDQVDASVGATFRYTGKYRTTFSATLPSFDAGDYAQVDARFGLRYIGVDFNAYVTNLFDKRAYQTIFPAAATYAQGVVLRPRTIGINTRFGF